MIKIKDKRDKTKERRGDRSEAQIPTEASGQQPVTNHIQE
jgi:hypothetical protein